MYVHAFPGEGRWQVSSGGGTEPVWGRDGRHLFYRRGNDLLAVTIAAGSTFAAGTPTPVISVPFATAHRGAPNFDVSPDGKTFVLTGAGANRDAAPTSAIVVMNWFNELQRRMNSGS